MDKESPKPGRLESLSSRSGTPSGLAGRASRGRFTPNMVNRRSKQERDASAPPIKPEAEEHAKPSAGPRPQRRKRQSAGPSTLPLNDPLDPVARNGRHSPVKRESIAQPTSVVTAELVDDRPFVPVRLDRQAEAPQSEQVNLAENQLYMFQLPKLAMPSSDGMSDELEISELSGQLEYRQSGKVTLRIGNTVMEVLPGINSTVVEDVMLVGSETGRARRLGTVSGRYVLVPDIA